MRDGVAEGLRLGLADGDLEGEDEGLRDGVAECLRLGLADGDIEGALVGLRDGFSLDTVHSPKHTAISA